MRPNINGENVAHMMLGYCLGESGHSCLRAASPLTSANSTNGYLVALIGVLGVVVGIAGTWFTQWHQAKRIREAQLADQERASVELRQAEIRARMDVKCEELLTQLALLRRILFSNVIISHIAFWPDNPSEKERARAVLVQIEDTAAFLAQPLRRHVEALTSILPDLERLVGERYIREPARSVAFILVTRARTNVARYLRGETVPTDYSDRVEVYMDALQELTDSIEHELEQAENQDEAQDGPGAR